MQQDNPSTSNTQTSSRTPLQLTALTLKSVGQLYDMNMSAMRLILQTQARSAAALGLPDWSALFSTVDERARNIFSSSTEQFLNTAQCANEAATELQREIGRAVETQTADIADMVNQGIQQLGAQTSEGFSRLVQTARQQAEQTKQASGSMSQEIRDKILQNSEQYKGSVAQASQRSTSKQAVPEKV